MKLTDIRPAFKKCYDEVTALGADDFRTGFKLKAYKIDIKQ